MKPINLNQARKAKARVEKRVQADANAARFGRTKTQKAAEDLAAWKLKKHVQDHKLDT